MIKINPLSTLYVGIDVSSKSNYVCALDFYKNKSNKKMITSKTEKKLTYRLHGGKEKRWN